MNKMKRFPTFNEVTRITTSDLEVINFMKRDARKEVLEAIVSSNYFKEEDGFTNFLIETVLINNYQHKLFEGTLTNDEMYVSVLEQLTSPNINEGKLKDWFDNKVETVKKLAKNGSDKLKEVGYKFINKLKGFGDIVNYIVKSIAGFCKAAWDFFKKAATSTYGQFKDEIAKKWKEWTEKDEGSVIDEVASFGKMSKHAINWATNGFPKSSAAAIQKAGNEEVEGSEKKEEKPTKESYQYIDMLEQSIYVAFAECIREDSTIIDEIGQFNEMIDNPESDLIKSLNEGGDHGHGADSHTLHIPFISKIVNKIGHLPPFKYLHNIESWVKEKTNNMFHKISIWLNKVAQGPEPYEYFYIGASAGLMAGNMIKSGVKELVKAIGSAAIGVGLAAIVPGIGFILTILKYMATGIWIVEVAQTGISAASEAAAKTIASKKKEIENEPASTEGGQTSDEAPEPAQ